MDRKCVCIMLSFYAQCAVKVVYTDFTRPVLLNLTSFFSVYEIHLIERLTSPRPKKKKKLWHNEEVCEMVVYVNNSSV